MMSSFPAYSTSNTARNVVFKITVKCLVFTIFNFEIGKVTSWMLCGKRPFLHIIISISVFLFLFIWIGIIATGITAILVIEGAIRGVIRYLAHTFWIYRHGLMCFLGHSENFTHWTWSWSGAHATCYVAFLNDTVLFSELLEIWMFQRLSCRHSVVMIVN